MPPEAAISIQLIFCLSGICNVLLFLLTRPSLLLSEKGATAATHDLQSVSSHSDTDSIEGGT